MKSVQFQATIDGVTSKKDRTLSVKLGTQELAPEDMGAMFDIANDLVWVAIAEAPVSEDNLNIPEALAEFKTDKTPSQRLRNVLHVYWQQQSKDKVDWEIFYRQKVEMLIDFIKDKLD